MIGDASKVLKFAAIVRGFTWWTLLLLTDILSFYLLKQIEGSSSNFKITETQKSEFHKVLQGKSGPFFFNFSKVAFKFAALLVMNNKCVMTIWQLPPLPPVGNNLMTEELLSVTGSHLRRGCKHLHAHFSFFYGRKRLFVCACFDSFCNQLKMTIS